MQKSSSVLILVGCIFLGSALGIGINLSVNYLFELKPLVHATDTAFRQELPDRWYLRMFLNGITHSFTFLLPAVLYWKLFEGRKLKDISEKKLVSVSLMWVALAVIIVLIPINQKIIEWNQNINLPTNFDQIENWMRVTEYEKSLVTQQLLQIDSFSELIVALGVFGVVGPIGEEVLFRGVLQRKLIEWKVTPAAGIWIVALLFSIIHFQFYGFFPRLFLGALFGYLFYWSGNLWVAIGAHVVNNSVFVMTAFVKQNWPSLFKTVNIVSGNDLSVFVSVLISVFMLFLFRKKNLNNRRTDN
ncbi:MAG TPA: CPBP family intramembrane glutamic endopeptidase [Dyadobacter sp.]|jgi:hypothetical protein|nr:CPBP family intramembrane glutamic endopeptidase [Dyadobacter sp.]